jgi:uncharacterized protein (TIGR02271 family)
VFPRYGQRSLQLVLQVSVPTVRRNSGFRPEITRIKGRATQPHWHKVVFLLRAEVTIGIADLPDLLPLQCVRLCLRVIELVGVLSPPDRTPASTEASPRATANLEATRAASLRLLSARAGRPINQEFYMAEHIVAVFETETDATAAAQSLESAGIPSSAIRQYADNAPAVVEPLEHTSTHTSGGGFWAWLFGEDSMTETTRSAYGHDIYDRKASAGNVVLSVTVYDDAKIQQSIAALEAHNPVDIDERSDEVISEKGTGMAPPVGLSTTGQKLSTGELAQGGMTSAYPSGHAAPAGAPEAMSEGVIPAPAMTGKGEEVIPLSEEQLEVGKRTVDRGTTHIRRYVVEKPVEQNVTLQSERVTVERRTPIATAAAGSSAFEERVVEVRETAEEPVVAKTAHVVEEVVVGREATERTETVKDTVRREDVEVLKDGDLKR